ncbi:hypothetical protein [Halorubrum tailed virus BLv36]|nr:hypothetical protein [Halorubrum tailed virus BLv36]
MRYEHADYKDTDGRGRVTLGKEHANSKVVVAWAELDEPNPDDAHAPVDEVRNKLTELWQWAKDNDYKALDFDPTGGKIYTKNAEWVNTDVKGLAHEVDGV